MRYLLTLFVLFTLSSCSLNKNKNIPVTCSKYYDKDLKMDIYTSADDIPLYAIGEEEFFRFMIRNFKSQERIDGMRWSINVSFVVDVKGGIRDAKIKNKEIKDYSVFDIEAIRILNLMPKWKPAKCKGKNVAFLYRIQLRMQPKF